MHSESGRNVFFAELRQTRFAFKLLGCWQASAKVPSDTQVDHFSQSARFFFFFFAFYSSSFKAERLKARLLARPASIVACY